MLYSVPVLRWFAYRAMATYVSVAGAGSLALLWLAILSPGRPLVAQYWFYVILSVWLMALIVGGLFCAVLAIEDAMIRHSLPNADAVILQRRIGKLETELTRRDQR